MEPSTDNGWGRSAWSFLHCLTLDERSTVENKRHQRHLLFLLKALLPCRECRGSYQNIYNSLSPSKVAAGIGEDDVGDLVCRIHEQVNIKLQKPAAAIPCEKWKVYHLKRCKANSYMYGPFQDDMFFFLFTLVSNYPALWSQGTQIGKKYVDFFTTLSKALPDEQLSRLFQDYIKTNPLDDISNRRQFQEWLYGLYIMCTPQDHALDLSTILETMDAMRIKMKQ